MSDLVQRSIGDAATDGIAPDRTVRPCRSVRYAPGEGISHPRPGDVILICEKGWLGRFIRFFQRRRYRTKNDRQFTHWSHVALIVSPVGHLIEVAARGVILTRIEKYRNREYHYVYLDLTGDERREIVRFAQSCLKQRYGVFGFVVFGLALLSGDRFRVPDRGQQGCGALVVRALQRAGMTFERRPTEMMPADLAKRFGVPPPDPSPACDERRAV